MKETEIEGLQVFSSIGDVPERPDMVGVYVQPEVLSHLLPEIAARGCDELWINPGAESDVVIAEAERLGLNVIRSGEQNHGETESLIWEVLDEGRST